MQLDLNFSVAACTAPLKSYHNLAECVMSTFKLGLENVALNRPLMSERKEKR